MSLSCVVRRVSAVTHARAFALIIASCIAIGAALPAAAASSDYNDQQLLDLGKHHGKVIYLDFWASWCAPCAESFPYMEKLKQDFPKDGLEIIAVNLDHSRPRADAFLTRMNSDLQVIYDPKGALAAAFGVKTMPTSILIDRNGKVRYVHAGFHDEKTANYDNHLRELLREK